RATLAPGGQLDRTQVGHEVGFPNILSGTNERQIAFTRVVVVFPDARLEEVLVLEDELVVVIELERERKRGGRGQQRAFLPVPVEVAMRYVQRDGEHAVRLPLETVRAAVRQLDLRTAVTFDHVHDFFIEMALR